MVRPRGYLVGFAYMLKQYGLYEKVRIYLLYLYLPLLADPGVPQQRVRLCWGGPSDISRARSYR